MKTQRPGVVLAVTSLAAFLAFLDVTIINIAFPAITAAFPGAGPGSLAWVVTAYNIVFAALLVPAGRLADQRGRKRAFLTGLGLFGAASVACASAPTLGVLIAARTLQAVAAALVAPSSLALLLPAFPAERRGFAVGVWGAMGGVAAAAGPALGGLLVHAAGWRAVFLVNLPVVALTLAAGAVVLAESRDTAARLPDPVGVAQLGGGVALLAWGIDGGATSWTAPGTLGPLLAGLALLAAFARRIRRVPAPLVEPALFRVRSFRGAIAGYVVFAAGFYALLLANVLFLTGRWHWSVLAAGLAVTPGPLMAALASAAGGRLTDRFGARAVIVPGALVFALGCVLFAARIGPVPAYAAEFLPATLLTGTGVGLVFSGLGVATVAGLPPARYATGTATGTCARQIGAVLGLAALLSGLAAGTPFPTAWMAMAGAAALTAIVAASLVGARPAPLPAAAPVAPRALVD